MNEGITAEDGSNPAQVAPRQTWQVPRLARMGSVAELTRKVDFAGNKDNTQFTFVKT